jgi:hypothetical protein
MKTPLVRTAVVAMDMSDSRACPKCRAAFAVGEMICPKCGWQPNTATHWVKQRPSVYRLAVFGLAVLGFVCGALLLVFGLSMAHDLYTFNDTSIGVTAAQSADAWHIRIIHCGGVIASLLVDWAVCRGAPAQATDFRRGFWSGVIVVSLIALLWPLP